MCNCQKSKLSGMKTGKIGMTVRDGVAVALGIAAGKLLTNNIDVLKNNPMIGAVAQIVGASIISGVGGKNANFTREMAKGMSANAMVSFLQATNLDLAKKIGLAGGMGVDSPAYLPAPSVVMPGVAGIEIPNISVR